MVGAYVYVVTFAIVGSNGGLYKRQNLFSITRVSVVDRWDGLAGKFFREN